MLTSIIVSSYRLSIGWTGCVLVAGVGHVQDQVVYSSSTGMEKPSEDEESAGHTPGHFSEIWIKNEPIAMENEDDGSHLCVHEQVDHHEELGIEQSSYIGGVVEHEANKVILNNGLSTKDILGVNDSVDVRPAEEPRASERNIAGGEKMCEQHANIKFCVKLGKSPIETLSMLQEVYGASALSESVVLEWHNRFSAGWTDNAQAGHQRAHRRQKTGKQ